MLTSTPPRVGRRIGSQRERGLSLVEMMVGVTIGLFVVAGASVLMVSQLGENRRLLLETQVQQDLRATADIITRDLRRARYNRNAVLNIWLPDLPNQMPTENPMALLDLSSASAPSYRYTRGSDQSFQISLSEGVLRRRIGAGTPQPMTDDKTLQITAFSVATVPGSVTTTALACPNLCPDGTQACWPTVDVRDLAITIQGRAVSDASVVRSIQSRVRVRNDGVTFNAAGAQVCP